MSTHGCSTGAGLAMLMFMIIWGVSILGPMTVAENFDPLVAVSLAISFRVVRLCVRLLLENPSLLLLRSNP